MAVTVVANTAAELSGKYVGEARLKTVTFSRNNAQILALPSGPSEILAAVANRLFVPMWAVILSNFSAGAYTNVHAGGTSGGSGQPYVWVANNNENGSFMNYIANSTPNSFNEFTTFFTGATKRILNLSPSQKVLGDVGDTIGLVNDQSATVGNLVLVVNNGGSGNFTGGNSANTLTGTVGYLEIVV